MTVIPLPALDEDTHRITHRYVTARGARFHVAEAGPADGPPVVLLHGFPQHWYVWRHVLPQLAATHRVLALDLRGCGWSEAPKHGYSTDSLAEDVIAVLDALGIGSGSGSSTGTGTGTGTEQAAIVGHDWGGWVGFVAALKHPERVRALVSVNMTHVWPVHRRVLPNLWRMWHTAFIEHPPLGRLVLRHTGFAAFLLRHWSADPTLWDREDLRVYTDLLRAPGRARAVEQVNAAYVWREIFGHPLGRYRKARLSVPTLIIGGERDVVIPPAVLEGGERHADELSVVVLPGGGHLLPEEQPGAVAEQLLRFLG
ncbi:pimeloyl-ACP methyl ester carboxylesterase [Catenulispora sp. MAP12-49]|uniref:alpha/beta fold hydrolase n=1 Tax=Catenulispora sp. MAP12-49 TaxID=3156302 RepID=UPI003512A74B